MKISFLTLGCKVNQYEADKLANCLKERGHIITDKTQDADCYILSTCAVTNEAERKSRQMLSKLKNFNKNAKIIVCGCASQNDSSKFIGNENVTVVLGTAGKNWIPELLNERGDYVVDPACDYEDFEKPKTYEKANKKRNRAYVKVQDGCNNFCSYCLIPYIRGRSRSRDFESVIVEVFQTAKNYHEIILTGINLSEYGKDIQTDLFTLLSSLSNINARIRLSSIEMNIVTPEFIKVVSQMPNFCDHFHLSLQSGCNKTLKEMNRKYTIEEFKDKVKLLKNNFPKCAITTDLIVGFPGETDEDFNETLKNVEEIGFADMHIFPYSPRQGTVAADRKDRVNGDIVKSRLKQIYALRDKMKFEFLKSQNSNLMEVLIEEEKDGYFVGHSRNFIKVYIKSDKINKNDLVMVMATEPFKDGLMGNFVKNCEI